MYLETERLLIRSIEPEDETAFIEMASDGSLDEDIFGGYSGGYQELIHDWVKEAMQLDKEDNPKREYLAYTIVEKQCGIPIGSVGCSYDEQLGQIGIVYFIGASYRRRGYAAEAASAYVKYFSARYDGLALRANVRTTNLASCKVLEKSGFVLRETKLYKDFYDEEEKLYSFYKCRIQT